MMEDNSSKKALMIAIIAGVFIALFFLSLFFLGIRLYYKSTNPPQKVGLERKSTEEYIEDEETSISSEESAQEGKDPISYPVVDTNQTECFDNRSVVTCTEVDSDFYGQDAQYSGSSPSYTDNFDGTITDNVTGLIWAQDPGEKMTYDEALQDIKGFELAGYTDWRIPSIKELYSLIDFTGLDPNPEAQNTINLTPFIDQIFNFQYGDTSTGDRIIDSQYGSSTVYVSETGPRADKTLFGVNFADGRIKGYGMMIAGKPKTFYFLYVRGEEYGENAFIQEGELTVVDKATGLEWMRNDNEDTIIWSDALKYCEDLLLDGKDDWRLPSSKELHTILDYSRSPETTGSAAIDPIFLSTTIQNEKNEEDYGYYWSSTTHRSDGPQIGSRAVYFSFGRAMGYMNQNWHDVHGAGAQRSDPKSGDPSQYPFGLGPQGDAIRIYNFARCVRDH